MGNTLTTATVLAADQITPPAPAEIIKPSTYHHHVHKSFEGTPPPECPMHKPADQKPQAAPKNECPIDHTNQSDINPLNMVIILLKLREK